MKTICITIVSFILFAALVFFLRPRISIAQSGGDPPALISQVSVTRSSDQSTIVLQSRGQRVHVDPSESLSIHIELSPGSGPIHLVAPSGGSINNQGGHMQVQTSEGNRIIDLNFAVGPNRGRYSVEISDGERAEEIDFWAGSQPESGQPGPNLTFN